MTALAGKRQEVSMTAIATPHPGKSQVQVPAVPVPINYVPDRGPEKPVLPPIAIIPDHLQVFEMILHALKVRRLMRIERFVDIE